MSKNFATSLLTNAPGTGGTSVTVTTGTGSRFVTGLATVGPDATTWTPANAEVVTITNVSSDTLTVTRQSESSTAMNLAAGYRIVQGVTAGMYDALVTGLAAKADASSTTSALAGKLAVASNLADLASASTARANLGLGGAAVLGVGSAAGTVAAGDDGRLSGASAYLFTFYR